MKLSVLCREKQAKTCHPVLFLRCNALKIMDLFKFRIKPQKVRRLTFFCNTRTNILVMVVSKISGESWFCPFFWTGYAPMFQLFKLIESSFPELAVSFSIFHIEYPSVLSQIFAKFWNINTNAMLSCNTKM